MTGFGVQGGTAVGVGVGLAEVVIVIKPGGVAKGKCVPRSPSLMKNKSSGLAAQVSAVFWLLVLLTLFIFQVVGRRTHSAA